MTQTKLTDVTPKTGTRQELPDWPDPPDMSEYTPSPTTLRADSVSAPTPAPADRYNIPTDLVTEDELESAVDRLLDNMGPVPRTTLYEAIADLPRWIDDADKPKSPNGAGPMCCDSCGSRQPWKRPLEQGRELALTGDDGNPGYNACGFGKYNVESCTCCGCPSCGNRSIYKRKEKSPAYRCRTQTCKAEFEHPVELPLDIGDVRRCLFWECRYCGAATLAPFEGVPEGMV